MKKNINLPKGVYKSSTNKYSYSVHRKSYCGYTNLNDAIKARNEHMQKEKNEKRMKILSEPILRNAKGHAIIEIFYKGIKKCETSVSDDQYYDIKQYKWYYAKGYIHGTVNSKNIRLSRYVMHCYDEDKMVDHVNSDTMDNRKEYLVISDAEHNGQNKSSAKGSTSKYVGVSYHKKSSKWQAVIILKSIKYHLGTYSKEIDAARARDKKAIEFNNTLKTTYKINIP